MQVSRLPRAPTCHADRDASDAFDRVSTTPNLFLWSSSNVFLSAWFGAVKFSIALFEGQLSDICGSLTTPAESVNEG